MAENRFFNVSYSSRIGAQGKVALNKIDVGFQLVQSEIDAIDTDITALQALWPNTYGLKIITGTTGTGASTQVAFAHGLDATKIIFYLSIVHSAWGGYNTRVLPNDSDSAVNSSLYSCTVDPSNLYIKNGTTNYSNISGRPFIAVIIYEL